MNKAVSDLDYGGLNTTSQLSKTKKHAVGGMFLLLVLLSLGLLLQSTISWMLDEQRLPLSKLVLQGELEYVSGKDVQLALRSMDYVGTFMSQDVDVLQQVIVAIPWVAQASIRKQWPDLVKIYLVEHKASAIWNGNALLNTSGDVFNADVAELKEDRVKLYGPQGSSRGVLDTWRQVSPMFAPLGLKITSLVLNDRHAWQIILDNGIRLELGKESLIERVARFTSLYYRLGNESQRVSYVDLRYDTGAAVGWFPDNELEEEQEKLND
ncbi:cell division protein FtsQ/DivIB [Vibrio sp. DW001]|uniref:cell division protein FtsQ/DivIB n=1 Tax=Vibrio sp. DW001 TaxID=2912315 RepID=UPI0023B1C980|nr:cell division protein FtsQ/DivIB [Vibrio sp. DW001]WED26215.1 cell division protein FtsQ/DivIB [Vibrio sp. DW001]